MDAYGVSRLRLSTTADAPIGSQLLTLVPVASSVGTIYTAVDTLGNPFLFAWCNVENSADWPGAKVFLMADSTGTATLQSDGVRWIVTGEEIALCAPLILTSGETPLV